MKKKLESPPLPRGAKESKPVSPFPPDLNVGGRQNWDFGKDENGKDRVPDAELVVCCYWEYARESASIRDAVKIAKTARAEERIPKPETDERDAFRATVNQAYTVLHRTCFDLSFWVGLPFPEPWQLLDKTKRGKWALVFPKIPTPFELTPFGVIKRIEGIGLLGQLYEQARGDSDTERDLYAKVIELEKHGAGLAEADELRKQISELMRQDAAVRGLGGVDTFAVQINWRDHDDKQIVECFKRWVKAKGNRPVPVTQQPKGVRGLKGGKGKDPQEWRAMLERLGIMRLLRQRPKEYYRLNKPKTWELFKRTDWYRSRRQAKAAFHELFPFLPSNEDPLSYSPPRRGKNRH